MFRMLSRRRIKILTGVVATAVAITIALSACGVGQALRVASALTAHELCSHTFIAGRAPEAVFTDYVQAKIGVPVVKQLLRYRVDRAHHEVTASVAGVFGARAVFARGRGCTVMHREGAPPAIATEPLPAGGFALHDGHDPEVMAAIDGAFLEPAGGRPLARKAILVVADGQILGERYAEDSGPEMPLHSWSMAKSITNAMIGILVRDGVLAVDTPAPIAAWRAPGDPRRAITIDHLLRQTSGQPFGHTNTGFDAATRMQFLEPDTAGVSAAASFPAAPGARWSYTDGNYAILSGIMRDAAGGTPEAFVAFARRELFGPVGMTSALVELDEVGTPMGASWVFATARDWARFGLLYAHDGMVGATRVLPEGWVAYTAQPTPQAELGYGAGFFTNLGPSTGAARRRTWGAPADSFFALGNSGQVVLIVPSHRLVVVSMGFSLDDSNRAPVEGASRLAAIALDRLDARR